MAYVHIRNLAALTDKLRVPAEKSSRLLSSFNPSIFQPDIRCFSHGRHSSVLSTNDAGAIRKQHVHTESGQRGLDESGWGRAKYAAVAAVFGFVGSFRFCDYNVHVSYVCLGESHSSMEYHIHYVMSCSRSIYSIKESRWDHGIVG